MVKAVLVVTTVLLVSTGTCNYTCRDANKFKTVGISVDEILNKRINIVYFNEEPHWLPHKTLLKSLHMQSNQYPDVKTLEFVFYTSVNFTNISAGTITFRYGSMVQMLDNGYEVKLIVINGTWNVLAKTDEGAMLVYQCSDLLRHEYCDIASDARYIIIPSRVTEGTLDRVPINDVLSKESLNYLLSVDKSYNFNGDLRKVPYVEWDKTPSVDDNISVLLV